jgi:hypothetical protein
MKQLCARLLMIAVLGSLLAMTGCIVGNNDIVITDKVCVTLNEVQTTGTFSSFVVCDQFKEQLEKSLKKYNRGKKDVKSIHMVGATFKTKSVKPHDWNVTANIDIARQDKVDGEYEDGPAPFVEFDDQSLLELKGDKTKAEMHADGVDVVNDALAALVDGEDPRLVLLIENETVEPTPSETDPMEFRVETCVKFQIVVTREKKR